MIRFELPSVRRPFVLLMFVAFALYLLIATAVAQEAQPSPGHAPDGANVAMTARDTASNLSSPVITKGEPLINYFEAGSAYREDFWVSDSDLVDPAETLTVYVRAPADFDVAPRVFTGPMPAGGFWLPITAAHLPLAHARLPVSIAVVDAAGHNTLISYEVLVSDPPRFGMRINVMAPIKRPGLDTVFTGRDLVFGLGDDRATTGFDDGTRGILDTMYCEYELPPAAPIQQFDARWEIPGTAGTYRDFYPLSSFTEGVIPPWFFNVNPGGTGDPQNLPIVITWYTRDAMQAPGTLYFSDREEKLVRVNMTNGTTSALGNVTVHHYADSIQVTIKIPGYTQFKIYEVDETSSGVAAAPAAVEAVHVQCLPNPARGATTILCNLPGARRAEIFDARGALVRTLDADATTVTETRFHWDGNDDRGTPCAAGAYHCRVGNGMGEVVVVR